MELFKQIILRQHNAMSAAIQIVPSDSEMKNVDLRQSYGEIEIEVCNKTFQLAMNGEFD